MKTKIIRQEVIFNALPDEVYNLLINEDLHSTFTGSETMMPHKEGKSFSVYGGYITGKNVELIPGEKIVQEWRAEE
jgi:activator of HSP90 ATPase